MSFFRGLLETYVQEHNVPVIDVASALAVISHDDKSFLLKGRARSGPYPARSSVRWSTRAVLGPSCPRAHPRVSVGHAIRRAVDMTKA